MRIIRQTAAAVALLAAAAAPATAQRSIVGVKGGVVVAGLRNLETTLDSDNQTGLAFGLFNTLGQGAISLQTELNLSKMKYSVTGGATPYEVDLTYAQPAAVLKLGLPLVALRPSAFGGVGYSIKVSCDYAPGDCDADVGPKHQWVGIFGLDTEIGLGSLAIVADGRYELGFSDISGASSVLKDAKSKAWILRAGIGWRH